MSGADGVVEPPPEPPPSSQPLPPGSGQSPSTCPPSAANVGCGAAYDATGAGDGELVSLDADDPPAIATVTHTVAATSTATTASQRLGRPLFVSFMRTSF